MAITPKKTLRQIGAGLKSVGERATGVDRNKILEKISASIDSVDENLRINTEAQFGILEIQAENAEIQKEAAQDRKRSARFKKGGAAKGSTATEMLSGLAKRYETKDDSKDKKGKKGGGILDKIFGGSLIAAAGGIAAFAGSLKILGVSLVPFSAGLVALGGGIAAVGAGIGVGAGIASWGLGSFFDDMDRLIEMDTEGLKENSEALAAFGGAMVELGKGGAGASLGTLFSNMMDGISQFFGGDTPLDKYIPQMKTLQEANLDAALITKNANAMKAFGEAMSAMGKGTTETEGALKVISQLIGESLRYLTGAESPIEKLESFAEKDIDPDGNIVKNTQHIIDYANALDNFPEGEGLGDALLNMGTNLVNWMSGAESPMTKFTEFVAMDIDSEKALTNINALVAFSDAMGKSKGVGDDTTLGPMKAIGSWISSWGQDDFIDKLRKFGEESVNIDFVSNNLIALRIFRDGMASMPAEQDEGFWSKLHGSFTAMLPDKDHITPMIKFTEKVVDIDALRNNIESMAMFAIGMNISDKIPEESTWDRIGNSLAGLTNWLGKDQLQVVIDQMVKFNEAFDESGIDTENFDKKTKSLFGFIHTFKLVPENLDKTIGRLSVLENVDFAKILKPISMFGEVELSDNITDNSKKVSAFVKAMQELSGIDISKTSPKFALGFRRHILSARVKNREDDKVSLLNKNAVESGTSPQPVILNNTPVNSSPSNVVNNVTNNYNINNGSGNDYLQADPQHDF